jgi:hypothetical protein
VFYTAAEGAVAVSFADAKHGSPALNALQQITHGRVVLHQQIRATDNAALGFALPRAQDQEARGRAQSNVQF